MSRLLTAKVSFQNDLMNFRRMPQSASASAVPVAAPGCAGLIERLTSRHLKGMSHGEDNPAA
jgi:hypothetical protein